jgi:cytochrome c oxidase assembly protein subunit 15
LVACQFALGITTLLLGVPVWAGALHQLGAVLLLGAVLATLHALGRARA